MYILPTIRINNGQYRGKLSVTEVMRALCAAFVKGKEPPACLKVKEDECRPGSVGESYCANNKCAHRSRADASQLSCSLDLKGWSDAMVGGPKPYGPMEARSVGAARALLAAAAAPPG